MEIGDETIALDIDDIGQSGNTLIISAGNLTLNDVAIQSDANGRNPAGNVTINSSGQITFNDSRIDSNANRNGDAGRITVTTNQGLMIQGPSSGIFASTIAEGRGGDITLNAPQITLRDNAEIAATTSSKSTGAGRGGDIRINASQLTFANGGQISASTTGSGQGGNLTVQNSGPLRIQGAGSLTVEGPESTSGPSGNLTVIAPRVTLDNGVTLSASTASEQGGGNIIFEVDEVLSLRRNSFINAQATNPNGGRGANVVIDAGFVIAVPTENSDIIANAEGSSDGGNIFITSNRLLGFTKRDNPDTPALRTNISSDISASSQLGQPGEISITDLALDPNQGLIELPTLSLPPRIQRGCSAEAVGTSSFMVTGRGGLAPSPTDMLSRDRILADLGPGTNASGPPSNIAIHEPANESPAAIIEAQGFTKDSNGQVTFMAQAPDATPHGDWQPTVSCDG